VTNEILATGLCIMSPVFRIIKNKSDVVQSEKSDVRLTPQNLKRFAFIASRSCKHVMTRISDDAITCRVCTVCV